jgi:hypothetical protein
MGSFANFQLFFLIFFFLFTQLAAILLPLLCNKPCIIAEIQKYQFVEILDVLEMCLQKVLNFSHVCIGLKIGTHELALSRYHDH